MLTQFYFIRHGETFSNADEKISGSGHNCVLTKKGKEQSLQAGVFLKTLNPPPSLIYYSPLERAKKTAFCINESLNLSMKEKHEFAEQNLGDWESQPWDIVAQHFIDQIDPPNGESYNAFHERIKLGLQNLSKDTRKEDSPPIVVSHGGVLLGIRRVCNIDSKDWPDNCAIFKIALSGDWKAPSLKETRMI